MCPPPRKSLVKGERFIRSEGRPELICSPRAGYLYCQLNLTLVGLGQLAPWNIVVLIIFISCSLNQKHPVVLIVNKDSWLQ